MTNNNYASKINNIMDKAKEDVRTQIDRAYQQGYADAKSELGQNEEYEKKQKQDTIQVGDEVYSEDFDWTFIVTKIITTKHMDNTVKNIRIAVLIVMRLIMYTVILRNER